MNILETKCPHCNEKVVIKWWTHDFLDADTLKQSGYSQVRICECGARLKFAASTETIVTAMWTPEEETE